MIWLPILRVRLLGVRNSLIRDEPKERSKAWRGLATALIMGLLTAYLAHLLLSPLASAAEDDLKAEAVLNGLPAFAFFTLFWALALSAITTCIQVFYVNADYPLYLVAPVRSRAVFFAKFVDACAANSTLFLSTALPGFLVYGWLQHDLGVGFLLRLVLTLAAFCTIPVAIGLLAAILLMRFLPANRSREVLGAIGVALFACLYFALSVGLQRSISSNSGSLDVDTLAHWVLSSATRAGFWAWAGDAIAGDSQGWRGLGLLGLLSGGLVAVAISFAGRAHLAGWLTAQESQSRGAGRQPSNRASMFGWLPGPVRAVLVKDLLCLKRDMRQLSMLFLPMAVVGVFLVNLAGSATTERMPSSLLALSLLPMLALITLRLSLSGFAIETQSLWLNLCAPNPRRSLLWGKFAYTLALSLPLSAGTIVLYGLLRGCTGFEWALLGGVGVCSVFAFCGIGVGANVWFAPIGSRGVAYGSSVVGRLLLFAMQMVYVVLVAVIMGGAMQLDSSVGWWGAGLLLAGVSAIFAVLPIWFGGARLGRAEW